MTIEERITRLEDIEAIRQLQAKYQRCLDTREFDELAECFTDDIASSYGNGAMSYQGKDAVMEFLCSVMTLDMPSTHLIHGGEIDIQDVRHATAKWYLEDYLIHQKYQMKLHGAAIYYVEYQKHDERWLISSIGYERCYEYMEFRGLLNIFTLKKKNFLNRVKHLDPSKLGKFGKLFQYKTLKKKNNEEKGQHE